MKTLSWDRDRAHNPALSTEFLLLYTLHTADLRHSSAFVRNHKKTASCNPNSVESTGFFTPRGACFFHVSLSLIFSGLCLCPSLDSVWSLSPLSSDLPALSLLQRCWGPWTVWTVVSLWDWSQRAAWSQRTALTTPWLDCTLFSKKLCVCRL